MRLGDGSTKRQRNSAAECPISNSATRQTVTILAIPPRCSLFKSFIFSKHGQRPCGTRRAGTRRDGYSTPRLEAEEEAPVDCWSWRRGGGFSVAGFCGFSAQAGRTHSGSLHHLD